MLDNEQIKSVHYIIEKMLQNDSECRILLVYFGQEAIQIKNILNLCYGKEEDYIVDDRYAQYNPKIKSLDFLKELDCSKYVVLFSILNIETERVYEIVRQYFNDSKVYVAIDEREKGKIVTKCGKHSTGALCNHWLVESVGAFCSFAGGVDVVSDHPVNYVSTAPFIFHNEEINKPLKIYRHKWGEGASYIEGIEPRGKVGKKFRRITIGNDVWLGKNVLIRNGADIGNGVVAGAGAVITKSVPDYAVVVGVPAKIVRYRYTPQQIEALNKIEWWNWSDEKIKECYEDFLGNVDDFIKKHL